MGFEPGHKKAGGRKKGSKNKESVALEQKATALGVDPFEVLLLFAKGDWQALGYPKERYIKSGKDFDNEVLYIQPETRAKAAADACQYLHPKLKAIEHAHKLDASIEVFDFRYPDEENPNPTPTPDTPPKTDRPESNPF